ncbi:MAG: Crp/Fnr family transcriptional regulator [Candidatus Alcyoniella australis]|nr:Crp/Fnr family transcriptional regulator [Candidatus Alcyoniella australis]
MSVEKQEMERIDIKMVMDSSVFSNFTGDVKEVERITHIGSAKRNQMIYMPDDPGTELYFLKAGRVKICKITEDGREIILNLVKPGDVFGEMAVISEGKRENFAEIQENVIYYYIKRLDLIALMKSRPEVAIRLAKMIGERRLEAERNMESFLYKGVRERLASLLIKLAKDYGIKDARGNMLRIKITHQDLANLIGSSRETVSLTMGDFRKEGVIDINDRKIIIKDEMGLARIS